MNIETKVLEYINGNYRQSMYEFVEEIAEQEYQRGYEDGRQFALDSMDFNDEKDSE